MHFFSGNACYFLLSNLDNFKQKNEICPTVFLDEERLLIILKFISKSLISMNLARQKNKKCDKNFNYSYL